MVVNFGRDFREEISLTRDRRQLDGALAGLHHKDQPCHTRAAINWTLDRLATSEPGNRIMIMITNDILGCPGTGGGTPSETETVELAARSGVATYTVFLPVVPMRDSQVGWGVDPNSEPKVELMFLRALANRTGGGFFDLSNRDEKAVTAGLRPALNSIADELKRLYTLSYSAEPGKGSAKRRVEVKVRKPGVKIRAAKKEY